MSGLTFNTTGELLRTVGTNEFSSALMAVGKELIDADYCSLFAFDEEEAPMCLAADGVSSNRLAQHAAEVYLDKNWRRDPSIASLPARRRADTLFRAGLTAEDRAYLPDVFARLRIGDRIALLFGDSSMFLRLCFYRYEHRPAFSDREISAALNAKRFLEQAVGRHYSLIQTTGFEGLRNLPGRPNMRKRLKTINPNLSSREVEVCTMILQGITAEGISLELDISKTSVVTYRKRAYLKLGIATHNELFRACLCGS